MAQSQPQARGESETTKTISRKQEPPLPLVQERNFFLVFPKFEFKFPSLFSVTAPKPDHFDVEGEKAKIGKPPPDVVKFVDEPKPSAPPPLQLEAEQPQTSYPLFALPVYALGGFIILKWIWARWQERNERAKKSASSDDNQSSEEYKSPAGGEE